jgi:valyl-tRNA synthetase
MNTAAKEMNQALEEREFARSTQISHRYLYDELFDVFIENSKSILDGTPGEARSAMDTLYTTLESGLRMVSPFMPFLTEELWQRLPRRPGDNTSSITVAEYPEYDSSFHDPESEVAYALVLGCSRGIRSLLSDYAVKDKGVAYIAPLDRKSHETVSKQLSAIKALSGKTPVEIIILKAGKAVPTDCAVFPVSADANVYLEVKDRVTDAAKEAEKFKAKVNDARRERAGIDGIKTELSKVHDKDVTDALQSAESRKRDVEARLRALQETVIMFENMKI